MRRIALIVVLLSFGFLSLAFAQYSGPTYRIRTRSFAEMIAQQRRLVGDYCRYDYMGLRLTPDGWDKMGPLTTSRKNPDFNSIVVVSRYQMDSPDRPSDKVYVSYLVIGRYDRGIGFSRSSRSDTVTFRVQEKDGDLLIDDLGSPAPHVSQHAALAWLKERLAKAPNDIDKVQLSDAIKALETPATPK